MAALNGTFAFIKMHGVAMIVGKYLDLDVARIGDKAFQQDSFIAKAVLRLVLRR